MTPKTLEELAKLTPSEREELVTPDWDDYVDDDDSADAEYELDEETIAELRRRSAEAKANPGSGIPWSEVKRKLLALMEE
jgi:putative addiction module component (TIGR02574 family)